MPGKQIFRIATGKWRQLGTTKAIKMLARFWGTRVVAWFGPGFLDRHIVEKAVMYNGWPSSLPIQLRRTREKHARGALDDAV